MHKKTTKKKLKKIKRQQIIKKLDKIMSEIIRIKYSDENWYIECISCGKKLPREKSQCCHFINRWFLMYRFDYMNLRPWCTSCNYYRKEYHIRKYTIALIQDYWEKKVKEMLNNYDNYIKKPYMYKVSTPLLREMLENAKNDLVLLKNKNSFKL